MLRWLSAVFCATAVGLCHHQLPRCVYQLATHPFHLSAAGRTWIDTYGDMTLLNSTTGAKAYLYFTPCGWFGAGRYEVRPCPLPSCRSSCNGNASCFRRSPHHLPLPVLTQP